MFREDLCVLNRVVELLRSQQRHECANFCRSLHSKVIFLKSSFWQPRNYFFHERSQVLHLSVNWMKQVVRGKISYDDRAVFIANLNRAFAYCVPLNRRAHVAPAAADFEAFQIVQKHFGKACMQKCLQREQLLTTNNELSFKGV